MRTYTIVRKPEGLDWSRVPKLGIDTPLWGTQTDIRAWAQLCWDDEALYVQLSAQEEKICAVYPADDLLGMPCEDSCLEFFFSPMPGDPRYFNIEFNPNGCVYLGLGRSIQDLVRLIPEQPVLSPMPARTDGGWRIAYRVPFGFVRHFFPGFEPRAGWALRANCYKCGDGTVQAHYLSWNPCTSPAPDFHRPVDFGQMVLGGDKTPI